jgi:hypothetical protein
MHGTFTTTIHSSTWPSRPDDDTSFGLEFWAGGNGRCHYAIIFKPTGHLAIAESVPDATGNCFTDPERQAYILISDWEALRASGTVSVELTWSPTGVTLSVSDGMGNSREVSYPQPVVPDRDHPALPLLPLKIRLNADYDETYAIQHVLFIGEIVE